MAIVVGALMLLPAFGILTGGAALAVGNAVAADDDGYFRYTLNRVESDGVAVAATNLWLDEADGDAPWVFDWLDVDLRLRVEGVGETDEVFIGVARTAEVEQYIDGAAWSVVVELDGRTAVTEDVAGATIVVPPADVDIWTHSADGSGLVELAWPARDGDWSIVVMNTDGESGVSAEVELGARSGRVTPIAVTLIIVGGLLTVGAVVLVVVGARGRRSDDTTSPAGSLDAPVRPPSAPAPAATSGSTAQADVFTGTRSGPDDAPAEPAFPPPVGSPEEGTPTLTTS